MYCSACGSEMSDSAQFCQGCGRNVTQPLASVSPPETPSPVESVAPDTTFNGKSKKRLIIALAVLILLSAVITFAFVVKSSKKSIVPTGAGTGSISWSTSSQGNGSETISGSIDGLSVHATRQPDANQNGNCVCAAISGTIGSEPFTATVSGSGYPNLFVKGTFAGQPVSGTSTVAINNASGLVKWKVHGFVEGQPISGSLTRQENLSNYTFSYSFAGTIGGQDVTGAATFSNNGFTTSQNVK